MCSHAHVNKVNHGLLSTTHAYSVTYPFDCVSLMSAFRRPKQSFHKCLRRRSRNQILSNQRQNWVNVWLFFLMPEFDGTATKRTCVDVSDVLINMASDRSDHQWRLTIWWSKSPCWSVKSRKKVTKVLVIRIIVVLVLVSFCWTILVIFSYSYENLFSYSYSFS